MLKFVDNLLIRLFSLLDDTPFGNRVKRRILIRFGASVGKNVSIARDVLIRGGTTGAWKYLKIGNNVAIAKGVVLTPRGGLEIGDNVLIGYDCKVLTANHTIPPRPEPIMSSGHIMKRIRLENDCWIASHSVILPGILVGEGAIVGAGSVVTKDVPPFSIVAGNPAKKIKDRK